MSWRACQNTVFLEVEGELQVLMNQRTTKMGSLPSIKSRYAAGMLPIPLSLGLALTKASLTTLGGGLLSIFR